MNMEGLNDTIDNVPVYSCLWTYQNYGNPTQWFYGLTDTQAINFGFESSPDNYTDHWVDLQAPIHDSASWTFTSWGRIDYRNSSEIWRFGPSGGHYLQ